MLPGLKKLSAKVNYYSDKIQLILNVASFFATILFIVAFILPTIRIRFVVCGYAVALIFTCVYARVLTGISCFTSLMCLFSGLCTADRQP